VALKELSGDQLFILRRVDLEHKACKVSTNNDMQGTIRCYPEAFLAKSVIVCEGASEIGLLRGLDLFRIDQGEESLAALGVALVDANGVCKLYTRASAFQSLGYRVMVLRDDDAKPKPDEEEKFKEKGGTVVKWRDGRALEDELFYSLTPTACQQLIDYATELHSADKIAENIKSRSSNKLTLQGILNEIKSGSLSPDSRCLLGKTAHIKNAWFKSISWMEHVARTIVAPDLVALPDCDPDDFHAQLKQVFDWGRL
jgi:hypothetical protein